MINLIIDNFHKIAGAILGIVFTGYVTCRIYRKNRVAQAAIVFRNKVLNELAGLYPVISCWDKDVSQSIPKIESAATEFRYFIPFYRKSAFDTALKDYCNYCKEITQESCKAYNIWPSMRKPGEKDPRETFKHIVKCLLSFAKEK